MSVKRTPIVINSLVWFGVVSRIVRSVINCIRTHIYTYTCICNCISAKTRHRQRDINRNKENRSNPLKHFPYPHHYSYDYLLFGVWHFTSLSIDNAIELCFFCIYVYRSIYISIYLNIDHVYASQHYYLQFRFLPFILPIFVYVFFSSISSLFSALYLHTTSDSLLCFFLSTHSPFHLPLFHTYFLVSDYIVVFPHSICLCSQSYSVFFSFLLVFSSFKFSNSLGFSFDWVMLCAATQYSRYDGRRKRNSSTSRDPSFKPGWEKVFVSCRTRRCCRYRKVNAIAYVIHM